MRFGAATFQMLLAKASARPLPQRSSPAAFDRLPKPFSIIYAGSVSVMPNRMTDKDHGVNADVRRRDFTSGPALRTLERPESGLSARIEFVEASLPDRRAV
jgi:hypothetical protein